MKIVHSPNFGRISQHMARNLAKEFLKLGVYIIHDNARRIPQKIDYNDAPQKENEDKTIKRKGHDTPLRDDFVLGSGANYTINGQPMVMASVPRTPDITLRLPENRRDIVKWLSRRGYVYWGISRRSRKRAQEILSVAWNGAVRGGR